MLQSMIHFPVGFPRDAQYILAVHMMGVERFPFPLPVPPKNWFVHIFNLPEEFVCGILSFMELWDPKPA